ncbi:hypothetical protein [Streptomyces sp. NPDC055085]
MLEEFYADSSKRDGRHPICKECAKEDRRRRYAADPDKYKQRMREYQVANRAKRSAYHWKRKLRVIAEYGGECACCGEKAPEFLTIDHVGGWGKEHRKQKGYAWNMVAYLTREGFPKEGFQLLCFNCNCALGIFSRCPHKGDGSDRL